jgi:hypothetical protein
MLAVTGGAAISASVRGPVAGGGELHCPGSTRQAALVNRAFLGLGAVDRGANSRHFGDVRCEDVCSRRLWAVAQARFAARGG